MEHKLRKTSIFKDQKVNLSSANFKSEIGMNIIWKQIHTAADNQKEKISMPKILEKIVFDFNGKEGNSAKNTVLESSNLKD